MIDFTFAEEQDILGKAAREFAELSTWVQTLEVVTFSPT